MGRRSADSSGSIAVMPSMKAWEAARHALGRLFSRAGVRRLSDERLLPLAEVHASNALESQVLPPGAAENIWRIMASVSPASLAKIEVRVSEEDRRPVARAVGDNHALAPPNCRVMLVLRSEQIRLESEKTIGPVQMTRLPHRFLALPPDPLRLWQTTLLFRPKTGTLDGMGLKLPKGKALRVPRLPAARLGPTRIGEVALSRVPLTRRGLEAPRGMPLQFAFAAEHQRLAETAALPPADVDLLGVFPAVPIIAVKRLVVEEEGRLLRLWLKPESWWGRPSPRRITLLVGRQISTGKMLQAAG